MKALRFLLAGVVFGVILVQSEAASWYRIQEMFLFHSIHMYGLLGTAVALGAVVVWAIRRYRLRDVSGRPIEIPEKDPRWRHNVLGGAAFGIGWGLVGACPGPIFVLLGMGYPGAVVILASALLGAFCYGLAYRKLPQ